MRSLSSGSQQVVREADAWARRNHIVIELCFSEFHEHARWPRLETLEHELELAGQTSINAERLAREMPEALGFAEEGCLVLLCRGLLGVEAAQDLLEDWYQAVRLAYALWLKDQDNELDSALIKTLVDGDPQRLARVSALLLRESWMFAAGNGEADGQWSRKIVAAVRVAREARNARELLDARAEVEWGVAALPMSAEAEEPARPAGQAAREDRWPRIVRDGSTALLASCGFAVSYASATNGSKDFIHDVGAIGLVAAVVALITAIWAHNRRRLVLTAFIAAIACGFVVAGLIRASDETSPAGSPRYGSRLSGVLRRFDKARRRGIHQLVSARDRNDIRRAALRLRNAAARAQGALAAVSVRGKNPVYSRRIVQRLGELRSAYGVLKNANRNPELVQARREVIAATQRLISSEQSLDDVGYQLIAKGGAK